MPWLQRGSYITFFTLVGDISRRQVSVGDISRRQANTHEIYDIFHFTAIHFLPERHSAMVLICIYTRNVLLSAQMGERASVVLICIITSSYNEVK